jgi:hypothetical protein
MWRERRNGRGADVSARGPGRKPHSHNHHRLVGGRDGDLHVRTPVLANALRLVKDHPTVC